MEDEQITQLFLARNKQAIVQLEHKHGRLCRGISYNILHNNEDVEECVNDAYLGIWNTVPPQHPNPLLPFACRIVRNISVARYHYNSAQKRGGNYNVALDELSDMLQSQSSAEESFELQELALLRNSWMGCLKKTELFSCEDIGSATATRIFPSGWV